MYDIYSISVSRNTLKTPSTPSRGFIRGAEIYRDTPVTDPRGGTRYLSRRWRRERSRTSALALTQEFLVRAQAREGVIFGQLASVRLIVGAFARFLLLLHRLLSGRLCPTAPGSGAFH